MNFAYLIYLSPNVFSSDVYHFIAKTSVCLAFSFIHSVILASYILTKYSSCVWSTKEASLKYDRQKKDTFPQNKLGITQTCLVEVLMDWKMLWRHYDIGLIKNQINLYNLFCWDCSNKIWWLMSRGKIHRKIIYYRWFDENVL